MKSNYSELGKYIKEINERNSSLEIKKLLGVSMEKKFIPSVANLNGVDMSIYKVIRKSQLACKLMSVGRDEKLPVDLYLEEEPSLVSSAYYVFEPINKEELLPEYLMMWLCRQENDRFIGFISGGDVRGGISWDTFCSLPIKVPSLSKQKKIVKEFNIIQERILNSQKIINKLEEAVDTIFKHWFVEADNDGWDEKTVGELCNYITDGKHGDCADESNSGYFFVSVKDLVDGEIAYDYVRQITKKDFEETHRRTQCEAGDILLTSSGTIGRMAVVKNDIKTQRTTFQKSVAILKPKKEQAPTFYLYSLLKSEMKGIIDMAGGSTISNLLLGDLRKYKIKYPGFELVQKYESQIEPLFRMKELKGKELLNLEILKNLLLSKLATIEN